MSDSLHSQRHVRAAEDLDLTLGTSNGSQVVESLSVGLNTVRDLLFQRIHDDVEQHFGMDSMSIPLAPDRSEYNAKVEIDIWQIIEAVEFANAQGYVTDKDWATTWLGELRLGGSFSNEAISKRVQEYLRSPSEDRRIHFTRSLEKVFPEARKSPLVLFQLIPHAVHIVVAVAFGGTSAATANRDRQTFFLPGILDCRGCNGAVLDNGETCDACANPVWNYQWLLTDD